MLSAASEFRDCLHQYKSDFLKHINIDNITEDDPRIFTLPVAEYTKVQYCKILNPRIKVLDLSECEQSDKSVYKRC